jgi:hypothetical protein
MDQMIQLEDDLAREFEPTIARDTVHRVVSDTYESLSDARITAFVPILARRLARERLRSLAQRIA